VFSACAASGLPCPGGCPPGLACDLTTGQCVEVRPEVPADAGRWASAAADLAGRLWVAAYAGRYGDLVVAHERPEGSLEFEYVDGLPTVTHGPPLLGDDVGLYASLALDLLGRPHVAYFDRTHGRLRYGTRGSQGWSLVTVPRAGAELGVVGRAASLALDASGLPRIAYVAEDTGSIRLARKHADGRWAVEEVQACGPGPNWPGSLGGEVGRPVDLVLDERGGEWVAYQDPCSGALRAASRLSAGWTVWELDPGPGAGSWLSAALDPQGNLVVAYHQRAEGVLRLARNRHGVLERLVLDDGLRTAPSGAVRHRPVGAHCALAFGRDRLPRILYQDSAELSLWLLEGEPDGGFRPARLVDGAAPTGFFASLAPSLVGLRAVSFHLARDAQGASSGGLRTYTLEDGSGEGERP
jgi:hypothetical protein